jgi:hypothetical protein
MTLRGYENSPVIEQFKAAMALRGLVPPKQFFADGKLHRWNTKAKNGRGDGSYLLHIDGTIPAGGFQNWQDGLAWEDWRFDPSRDLTAAERDEFRRKPASVAKARHETSTHDQAKASDKAQRLQLGYLLIGYASLEECAADLLLAEGHPADTTIEMWRPGASQWALRGRLGAVAATVIHGEKGSSCAKNGSPVSVQPASAVLAPPGPTRIAKLIRLLSSPVDGEVVGAAQAPDRVLTSAGGFHHLADVVEAHWRATIVVPPEPKPDWQILAARLLQYPNILLGNRESDVLQNKQRSRIAPTDKQWNWLGDIESRLPSSEQRMAS